MTSVLFVIQKHEHVPYMSVADCIRSNGDRHQTNARRHAADGNKEYAFGSSKKAKRNYALANAFDEARAWVK